MARNLIFTILTVLLGSLVYLNGSTLGKKERGNLDPLAPPPLVNTNPRIMKFMTLGHQIVYDRFVAFWLTQLLADKRLVSKTKPDVFYKAIESSLNTRPKVESIYTLACFTYLDDFKEPLYCETILGLGKEALPKSWKLPLLLGFVQNIHLSKPDQAAINYALAAANSTNLPYLSGVAKKLAQQAFGMDMAKAREFLSESDESAELLKLLKIPPPLTVPVPDSTPLDSTPLDSKPIDFINKESP
jgi:hypothetical protein